MSLKLSKRVCARAVEASVEIAKATNAISVKHGARNATARGVRAVKKRSLLRIKFTGEN